MQAAYDKIVRIHISSAITLRFNTWQGACFTTLLTNQRTNHMKKLKYIAPILIAVACLGFQQAKADTKTIPLPTSNSPGTLGAGPFGNVTVNLNARRNTGHHHIHGRLKVSICGRGVGCCQCQRQFVDNWKFYVERRARVWRWIRERRRIWKLQSKS